VSHSLARISHRVSARGRRGAVPSGVFDPRGAERVLAVRYGAPPALVSPRHQRVSDGLARGRAFGHTALLSAGRAPRGEKTPLGAVHRRSQQEAGEICGLGSRRTIVKHRRDETDAFLPSRQKAHGGRAPHLRNQTITQREFKTNTDSAGGRFSRFSRYRVSDRRGADVRTGGPQSLPTTMNDRTIE